MDNLLKTVNHSKIYGLKFKFIRALNLIHLVESWLGLVRCDRGLHGGSASCAWTGACRPWPRKEASTWCSMTPRSSTPRTCVCSRRFYSGPTWRLVASHWTSGASNARFRSFPCPTIPLSKQLPQGRAHPSVMRHLVLSSNHFQRSSRNIEVLIHASTDSSTNLPFP
jgi:hypothetical protein